MLQDLHQGQCLPRHLHIQQLHLPQGPGVRLPCLLIQYFSITPCTDDLMSSTGGTEMKHAARFIALATGLCAVAFGALLIVSPSEAFCQEPTGTPTSEPLTGTVTAEALNVRAGPGPDYQVVGTVHQDDTLTLMGRNQDQSWLYMTRGDLTGWISAKYVAVSGDLSTLPITEARQDQDRPLPTGVAPPDATPVDVTPSNISDVLSSFLLTTDDLTTFALDREEYLTIEQMAADQADPMQALSTYRQQGRLGRYMRSFTGYTMVNPDVLFFVVASLAEGYKTDDGAVLGFFGTFMEWGKECEVSSVQVVQVGDQVKGLRVMCPAEGVKVWYHTICFRKHNVVACVVGTAPIGGPSHDPLFFEQLTRLARIVEARIRPLRFGDE
jgi:hypothetical protein